MANPRPKVSRVKVKVSNVNPLEYKAKVAAGGSLDDLIPPVTIFMTLEEGSPPITADQYFYIVMLTPDNQIYKFPPKRDEALTNGTFDSSEGAYKFVSTIEFEGSPMCTFHKLKFSYEPAVTTTWSNLEKLVPHIDFSIHEE